MDLKIRKINFDVPFPSVTWNDTSMVPLNTVSKHYVIEYKEKLEEELSKSSKKELYIIQELKEQLEKVEIFLKRKV